MRISNCILPPKGLATAVLLVWLVVVNAGAATLTWDASGANPAAPTDGAGNWSTANANWANGFTDSVWTNGSSAIFGSGGAGGTVAVGAGTVVANVTFNTNYTLSSNPLTLSNSPTITVNGPTMTATAGVVLTGTGFTKDGSGLLVLNASANNTYTGETIINNGMVSVGGNDTRMYINGNLTINSGGTFRYSSGGSAGNAIVAPLATVLVNGGKISANVSGKYLFFNKLILENGGTVVMDPSATGNAYFNPTNVDGRSGGIFANLYRAIVINTFKSTAGTVVITNRPNTSAADGYVVTMNAGTLIFDKSSHNANRLLPNATLTLSGGSLVFTNGNSAINPSTENPGAGGTILNPGATSVLSTNAGATGGSVTFGVITRKTGGTLDFFKAAAGGSTVTNASVNGILGGWATWNKTDWLAGSGAAAPFTLGALAAASYSTDPSAVTWLTTTNVSLSGNPTANLDDITINSLRLTATSTVTINSGKTLTLSSGGLLVTGTGATTITGGSLLSGAAGGDLVIHQYASADLTIASDLANNSGSSLAKSGSGKLILTGANSMTGTNYLNGGVVEVSDLAKLASGPSVMNNGTLRYTGASTTENRAITFNGLGGTFDVGSGTTLALAGAIKGSGAAIGDLGGLTKIGAGALVLTASNYFNGPMVVSNGMLVISGTNSYDVTTWDAGKVTVYATLGGAGLISGPVTVKNGGTIAPGTSIGTLTLATNLTLESGSTNLFEVTNGAAGDALVVQGNLTIQPNSTIAIRVLGAALSPTTNTLITYAGTKTGSFNPTVVLANGSLNASVSIDESTPGQIKLVAVPQVVITSQPADQVVSTNDPASFTVAATGNAPLSFQWYAYGNNTNNSPVGITDATDATYSIPSAQGLDSGYYAVVVSNSVSSVSSRFALLVVGNVVPLLSGPTNLTVIAGNNATFNTTVLIANPQPTFRWQTNGVDVGGATTSSLTLSNVQYALDGTTVSVIASNVAAVVTNSATLSVIVTPVITPQPVAVTTNAGSTVVFSSGATGVPTPGLQWYKNNAPIAGQTGSTLTLAGVQGSDIATYKLVATNAAGSATSSSVKLTVFSTTLAATAVAPANLATGVCYDTPLYVTFSSPVVIINSGKIRIYNATNPLTPVDTIDMGSNTVVISTLNSGLAVFLTNNIQAHGLFPGDSTAFNYFPVIISNNVAAIYPHAGVMTSNQTYFVTLETGVVGEPGGAYFAGISDTNAWRFTTKPGGPAKPANLIVALDGSGDFATVQGAVDSLPNGGYPHTLINIRNGNYVEIVNISGKTNITLRGQSRTGTVVGYGNNNNLNPSTGNRMAFKVNANDIAIENLTLVNRTPQGGSQAETLMINTGAARFILNNADVNSLQDTILANVNSSQGYFYNSTVRGNFDYIWGGGNLFFTNCLVYTVPNIYVTNNFNLTAARTDFSGTSNSVTHWLNPAGSYSANGFSFVNCRLQADAAVTTVTLAGANGTPNGVDSFIGCLIDTNHYVTPAPAILSGYVLWENSNSNVDGSLPVSMGLTPVTGSDARFLAAGSATSWLYGWQPQLAPNLLTNPVSQTASHGSSLNFTAAATGIPEPTYQWFQDGALISGATNAGYAITNAVRANAGNYAVVASNSSGSETSAVATLTYSNTAPVAGANFTMGALLSVPSTARIVGGKYPPTDVDNDSLIVTSVTGATNGTVVSDGTNVTYTATNGADDSFTYTVSDGFGGTASATVTVLISSNVQGYNQLSAVNLGNGTNILAFAGIPTYNYALDLATNLVSPINWMPQVTNPAANNGSLIFTNISTEPQSYYRTRYVP